MDTYTPTSKSAVRQHPERAKYDKETIYAILDEGFVCQLAFIAEGMPFSIPTGYARFEDLVYLHGSVASRMVRTLSTGIDVCFSVTLMDGYVLARSAMNHSLNYRSVVAMGRARL